jgi:hypothetical protein
MPSRFNLLETVGSNTDSEIFSGASPATILKPELAFDTDTGNDSERHGVSRHL